MILRWLISAIGFAAIKGEATSIARRAGRGARVMALLALTWVTAFGFGLTALTVWLSAEVGVAAACAIVAGALAVIGLVVQVAMALRSQKKSEPGLSLPFPGLTASPDGAPSRDTSNLGAMAMVGIAGYLLGRQLFRR